MRSSPTPSLTMSVHGFAALTLNSASRMQATRKAGLFIAGFYCSWHTTHQPAQLHGIGGLTLDHAEHLCLLFYCIPSPSGKRSAVGFTIDPITPRYRMSDCFTS